MFPFKKIYKGAKKIYRGIKRIFRKKRRAVKQTAVLSVKKTILDDRLSVGNSVNVFGTDSFELADIPQYQTYAALYEEFRIDKVVYSFKALNNCSIGLNTAAANSLLTLGMIHSVVDTNDARTPSSIQDMMNDPAYKGTRSNRNHTRTIKPKFLTDAGGNTPVQPKRGWMTCFQIDGATYNAVSHYGIKWCFEGGVNTSATVGNQAISFMVEPIITYYVSFKNPR